MRVTETAALITLGVVLFKVLLSGVVLHIGDWSLNIGTLDASTIAALLVPVLGAPHVETLVNRSKEP